ncbi:MAG: hypothetical protein QOC63_5044 [Mycobacterium sp.]|jgi:hypothetical protein|nr:hypothetical protein [Mycobacterium sp.]
MRCGRNNRERDWRLRPDGVAQYGEIAGQFAGFAADPCSDPHFARDPMSDEVDVAIGTQALRVMRSLRTAGASPNTTTGIATSASRLK